MTTITTPEGVWVSRLIEEKFNEWAEEMESAYRYIPNYDTNDMLKGKVEGLYWSKQAIKRIVKEIVEA